MLNFINVGNFHGPFSISSLTLSYNISLWINNQSGFSFSAFQLVHDIVGVFFSALYQDKPHSRFSLRKIKKKTFFKKISLPGETAINVKETCLFKIFLTVVEKKKIQL